MSELNYITSSCVIDNNRIFKNGQEIRFERKPDGSGFLLSAYTALDPGYPKFYKMDRLSKLGFLASEVLLKDTNLGKKYRAEETGIVLSNASSSLDADIHYYESTKTIPSPALFVYTLPNIVIGEICIRNGIKGENAFFIFPHFNPGFILNYVNELIGHKRLHSCICGWVECLDENYKAVLMLVEKSPGPVVEKFTTETINTIYQLGHG